VGVRLDLDAIDAPPVFGWLAKAGGVAESEMLRTFNCGIGMIAVVRRADSSRVARDLEARGEAVIQLGRIEACLAGEPQVRFSGGLGSDG
jgi:phosphoribosylformylglycinamidine cyclo-ligase